ncbi:MAG TPA: DNA repair protein RecN [Acidimicrobiales bacterium]|nr:DNA repair protein RecN [Acidimicrobiales bacterium]
MLLELSVRDLGVIADLRLVLSSGMTALTGETGAGKTLVVEAIELLVGGRADSVLVRPGASEAVVEGRFLDGADEVVLMRVVPSTGRSRAYIDGRMMPVTALAERGRSLVDLYGQHAHQSLLTPAVQRRALDAFAAIDGSALHEAQAELKRIDAALAELGGDEQARAREIDLLRFQVEELSNAGVVSASEDDDLAAEEERLSDATAHREAASIAVGALGDDGGAADALGAALAAVARRAPLAPSESRLESLVAEVIDLTTELRDLAESLQDDPERLAAVRERRHLLHGLNRKYGPSLADVLAFASEAGDRLHSLESFDARAAALGDERLRAEGRWARAAADVAQARRGAAPALAVAVQEHLRELAMPKATVEVRVGGADPANEVEFLLSANPGEAALPLTKVASGGELARAMLAARLVLTEAPGTLVFDEVDAGVGGEAALAVGRALARLARDHQVLVVTHLPQVAAFADHQVAVTKAERGGRTVASMAMLDGEARVVELSRMLAGHAESESAQDHARELLARSAGERSS